MASGFTTSTYDRAVRGAVVWGVFTSSLVTLIALPFVLGAALFLGMSPWNPVSIGEFASGLLGLTLGSLFLGTLLRSIVLAVVAVARFPGYPERHWWFVRRALRSFLRVELVMLSVAAGTTAFAIFGHGRLAEYAYPAAGVLDAIVVFFQLSVFSICDALRYARVVPYFPRRVDEIDTYGYGTNLARHISELDKVATSLGLTPLSRFGWHDDLEGEPVQWHPSAEGLKTVSALLVYLQRDDLGGADGPAVVDELKRIASALERANAQGIPFSLLLLHSTGTNGLEWELRRGTCF